MSGSLRRGRDGPSPRRLTPTSPHSRASSSRSEASRSIRSKSDDSEPPSPAAEPSESIYTITGFLPPRQRIKSTQKKVQDEWAKIFSKWPQMRTELDDQLLVDFHKENCKKKTLLAFLLKLSDPGEDDQLHQLEAFIEGADESFVVNIDETASGNPADRNRQQPRGWVDHQVWHEGWARPMTIPEQSEEILSPQQLKHALRPQRPIYVSGGHPDSFYRRLVYAGDADPQALTAMVSQATISQSWALGVLFRGHFSTSPEFRLQVEIISMPAKVANIIFHMPYLLLSKSERVDTRRIGDHPLRKTYKLSCLQTLAPGANWGPGTTELYLNEGMMSVALTVRDDRWWGVTCLKDEFLHKKSRLEAESDDEEDTEDEDEEDNDGEVPEINIDQQRRATERSGLRPVELDQVDPILDQGGGYTDRNPRVYMLIVLDTQLSILVPQQEVLYRALRTAVKGYDESSLPRADKTRHQAKDLPGDQIKDALDTVSKFLSKLFEIVKQQEDEVNRFMKKDLGLDPNAKTTIFKDPFFVGLNKLSDPSAKDSAMRIMQLVGKLHKLRHGVEDLQATVTKLRETVNRNFFEDLQIAQHTYASRGVKLGILHYVSQALTIPLNLYNIPHAVTKLPSNNAGLAGVTLGLTAVFMIAPFILSFLFEQLTKLRNYLLWKYSELRRDHQ